MESQFLKINVLGVGISTITQSDALTKICEWIDSGKRHFISVCTVHTVMECQNDPRMRSAVNSAGMATPDGMPLVWLGKLKSKRAVSRVYGPDLLLALCKISAERGYKHYFYGGASGVPEELARNMQMRFPGLKVVGAFSPPFRPLSNVEDAEIVDNINQAGADIVWVGLGTPKQDLWMAEHRSRLTASVLIGVGAAFDFHTGRVPQAPGWMQRVGLEWLFRFFQEPRRLWYRYLVYNPLFILLIIAQALKLKRFQQIH